MQILHTIHVETLEEARCTMSALSRESHNTSEVIDTSPSQHAFHADIGGRATPPPLSLINTHTHTHTYTHTHTGTHISSSIGKVSRGRTRARSTQRRWHQESIESSMGHSRHHQARADLTKQRCPRATPRRQTRPGARGLASAARRARHPPAPPSPRRGSGTPARRP